MRSGGISKLVELWKKAVTKDAYGGTKEDWMFHKNIRSFTFRKKGGETIANDEVFDTIKIKMQVRNQHDIEEMDRIKYASKMYIITFIQPDVSERWLTIECERLNE